MTAVAIPTIDTTSRRLCACGEELPVGRVQRRCRKCVRAYMRSRSAKGRRRDLRKLVGAAGRVPDDGFVQIRGLVTAMIRRFGGLGSFSQQWAVEISALTKQAPGSPVLVRSMNLLVRLMIIAEESQPKADQLPLTDEQFAARFRNEVVTIIQQQTQIVLLLAEELGYEVIPPGPAACQTEPCPDRS